MVLKGMQARHASAQIANRWHPSLILLGGAFLLLPSIFLPWLEIDTKVGNSQSATITYGLAYYGTLLVPLTVAIAASACLFLKWGAGLGLRLLMLGLSVGIDLLTLLGYVQMNVTLSNAAHTFGPGLLSESGFGPGVYLAAVAALAITLGSVSALGYQRGAVESTPHLWPSKHDGV
jgi:hypothetical protein